MRAREQARLSAFSVFLTCNESKEEFEINKQAKVSVKDLNRLSANELTAEIFPFVSLICSSSSSHPWACCFFIIAFAPDNGLRSGKIWSRRRAARMKKRYYYEIARTQADEIKRKKKNNRNTKRFSSAVWWTRTQQSHNLFWRISIIAVERNSLINKQGLEKLL